MKSILQSSCVLSAAMILSFAFAGCGKKDGDQFSLVNSSPSAAAASAATSQSYGSVNRWCELRGTSIYFDGVEAIHYSSWDSARYSYERYSSGGEAYEICSAPRGTRCWVRKTPGTEGFDLLWDGQPVLQFYSIESAGRQLKDYIDDRTCMLQNTPHCELRGLDIFYNGQSIQHFSYFNSAVSYFNQIKYESICR